MPGQSTGTKVTTDHEVIKSWVEKRGGHPAVVKSTVKGAGKSGGKDAGSVGSGLLRIDYPGFSGDKSLQPIDWEDFFEQFDKNELAFLYQEKTKSGKGAESRFSKLIKRDTAAARQGNGNGQQDSEQDGKDAGKQATKRASSARARPRAKAAGGRAGAAAKRTRAAAKPAASKGRGKGKAKGPAKRNVRRRSAAEE